MFERFTSEARAVVHRAQIEAAGLGHDYLGTEHFLLALFGDDTVAEILASVGVRRDDVVADLMEILGECERPRPVRPDAEALRALGIDLDEVRRRVDEAFWPGALEATCAWQRGRAFRFTPRAKRVMELSLREAIALGDRSLRAEHLLLGILAEGMGVAVMVLSNRAGSPGRVRRAVLDRMRRSA